MAMSRLEWIKKIIIVVGSVVAAYGITLALYAGFGGATLAVLWQGISETFHVSIGMASMIVAIIMITFAFFYDRSQIHIGTILYQIVYSFCVDLFANIHVYSAHLWVNALIMLLGIILFAMGTGIYAAASLGRGSYEALTFSLADKNGWQVKAVRMILDCDGCYWSYSWRKVWVMYYFDNYSVGAGYSVYSIKDKKSV